MLILGISGSLRADSLNTALLRAAAGYLPSAARMRLHTDLALVPPYSEDHDVEPAQAPVARLRSRIETADALLIATPEYNGSIPGQLKNALDWASRPYPDNALRHKPVAVIGASTGLFGAIWAQADLRKVLATAGAHVLDEELVHRHRRRRLPRRRHARRSGAKRAPQADRPQPDGPCRSARAVRGPARRQTGQASQRRSAQPQTRITKIERLLLI